MGCQDGGRAPSAYCGCSGTEGYRDHARRAEEVILLRKRTIIAVLAAAALVVPTLTSGGTPSAEAGINRVGADAVPEDTASAINRFGAD